MDLSVYSPKALLIYCTDIFWDTQLTGGLAEVDHLEISDSRIRPWTRYGRFDLNRRDQVYLLVHSLASEQVEFGRLDLTTTSYLYSLHTFEDISLQAILTSHELGKIPRKPAKKKPRVNLTINILGPRRIAEDVGEKLLDVSAFLQHPVFLDEGIMYMNPQMFYLGDEMEDLREFIGPKRDSGRAKKTSKAVHGVFESLSIVEISGFQNVDMVQILGIYLRGISLKRSITYQLLLQVVMGR